MPVTAFQRGVLKLLADNRSPESFVMGATVVNSSAQSPRFSQDIDISHDVEMAVVESAAKDAAVLEQHKYSVRFLIQQPLFQRATAQKGGEQVKLEWVFDSAFRFFPVEPDPELGWRLNFFDAATNKVLAMAGRIKARDFIDVIYVHEHHLSLGALCWAAAGKDAGMNPSFILEEAKRTTHYTAEDFRSVALVKPLNLPEIYQAWRSALMAAEALILELPAQEVGCLYLNEQNQPVTPDPSSPAFPKLRRHFGSVRGAWPVLRD